jgi:hypothetical protein
MEPSSTFPRLFTIDEANALLAVLRPLIANVLDSVEHLRGKSETVIRSEGLAPDHPEFMDRLQKDREVAQLVHQIKAAVEEIQSYGCMCKGIEQGLVDFPCLWGGEIVFLCWQYGENDIAFWHRIEDGFAGRRPLLDPEDDESSGSKSYH